MSNLMLAQNNGSIRVADSLDLYIAEVNRIPLLSKDDELTLARSLRDNNDLEAARTLVSANLRYVVQIAFEFKSYGIALKDLIQEGNIGLMKAVKKFDPEKGTRLVTYAAWWIRSEIQEFIIKTKGLVKRSARALKKKLFYKGNNEIKDHDGNLITTDDYSLDAQVSEGESDLTHLDTMESSLPGHAEAIAEAQECAIVKSSLEGAVSELNEKEQYIIEKRVMSENPMQLAEIGEKFSLSRERVRQIEKEALAKLKKLLERNAIPLNP